MSGYCNKCGWTACDCQPQPESANTNPQSELAAPAGSAIWKQYSTEPEKWALLLSPDHLVVSAVALVRKTKTGKWFAEHYPYMGEWCVLDTFEAAKEWAGCPWRHLLQNAPGERLPGQPKT